MLLISWLRAILLTLSLICYCQAQFRIEKTYELSPDSSLVFLDNDGNIVHKFDHKTQVITEIQDLEGFESMMVATPRNFSQVYGIDGSRDEKIDFGNLSPWLDKLKQYDLDVKKREANATKYNDEVDYLDEYEVVNVDGKLEHVTYSDKVMQISTVADAGITTIDMKLGFDLAELYRIKRSIDRYLSYDGSKKCLSNKFDRAIVKRMRVKKLSRPIFTRDNRFENPFSTWKTPSLMQSISFFVQNKDYSAVPEDEEVLNKILPMVKPNFVVPEDDYNNFRVTWLGHSTLLIQINGMNILTDPVFSDRASPSRFFGPKRLRPMPCKIEDLPKIDIILISHNHYDHLDMESLKLLANRYGSKTRWMVPLGLGSYLKYLTITNYIELDWWQKDCVQLPPVEFIYNRVVRQDPEGKIDENQESMLKKISRAATAFSARTATRLLGSGYADKESPGEIAIYFTPTQHNSRRGVNDVNRSLWGSFVIASKNNATFYFTGDSGYCSAFDEIGDIFGPFAGAAIPIGAYNPRTFLKVNHINPQEAVQVHRELRSKKSISIHHSTFILSYEPFREPAQLLKRLMKELETKNGVKEPFTSVKHGETVVFCTTC